MIITIRVTEAAIEHIKQETGLDEEAAGDLAQILVGLFEIKGTETPKYQKERELLRDLRELIERHKGNETFDFGVYHDSMSLESSLDQFISILEEEDKKREGDIPEGKGLPRSIFDPDAILWEIHKELTRLGHYPNKYPGYVEAIRALAASREGEGSEDRLFKTARALIDYCREYGAAEFKSRFGSLLVLEECERVVAEGEGNPHPWHGR